MHGHTELEIKGWCAMVIRGAIMRQPTGLQIRPHGSHIFIRAKFDPVEGEEGEPFIEMVVKHCKLFKFTPKSEIYYMNFDGEWPPYKAMKEVDRPQLVGIDGGKLNVT